MESRHKLELLVASAVMTVLPGCVAEPGAPGQHESSRNTPSSAHVSALLHSIQHQFRVARLPISTGLPSPLVSQVPERRTVIRPGAGVEITATSSALEVGPLEGKGGRTDMRISLPKLASGSFHITDAGSGVGAAVALHDALPAPAGIDHATIVYQGATPGGGAIVESVTPISVEDYVEVNEPDRSHLEYDVSLSPGVAGLRLVADTLELLDAGGVPRVHVSPPWLVDRDGEVRKATVSVAGCGVSTSPRFPVGQPMVPIGAQTCKLRVDWKPDGLRYPVLVDPHWSATTTMSIQRGAPTANYLEIPALGITGDLVVGGYNTQYQQFIAGAEYACGTGCNGSPVVWITAQNMHHPRAYHVSSPITGAVGYGTSGAVYGDPRVGPLEAGGLTTGAVPTNTAEYFDASTLTWVNTSPMHAARASAAIAPITDTRLLVVGGIGTGNVYLGSAEAYDFNSNSWVVYPSLAYPRAYHTATVSYYDWAGTGERHVLIAGGHNGSVVRAQAERYTPAGRSLAGTMPHPMYGHTATAIDEDAIWRVAVIGGFAGSGRLWLQDYRDSTNSWRDVHDYSLVGRRFHAAYPLINGIVISGGINPINGQTVQNAMELDDMSQPGYYTVTQMNFPRAWHPMRYLGIPSAGLCLLAPGGYNNGVSLATGDVYCE